MTFSRLTLGEPRLRGKVRGGSVDPPCVEERRTGQLLSDPSAESQTTGGLSGNELPSIDPGWATSLTYNDQSAGTDTEIKHLEAVGGGDFPEISTTNPRTGTSHVLLPGGFASWLLPGIMEACDPGVTDLNTIWSNFYTNVVTPGDVVDASGYAAEEFSFGTTVTVGTDFFTEAKVRISLPTETSYTITGTGYTQVSHSATAPANAHYLVVYFEAAVSSGGAGNMYMDDFSITVS